MAAGSIQVRASAAREGWRIPARTVRFVVQDA
jgi:hypothetical protein